MSFLDTRCYFNRSERAIWMHVENVFEKAKTLRDRFVINRDNGQHFYVRFFNNDDWSKNLFQVTNQVTQG